MIRSAFFAFSAMSLLLGACASNGGNVASSTQGTDPAEVQSFCANYCANIKACDAKIDERTCSNNCENVNAALFPKLRSDVVSGISACFDEKDCKSTLSGNFDAACMKEAQAKTAPSNAALSFCTALQGSRTKCKVSADKSGCLNLAKIYADDVLADAELCAKNSCSDVDTCVGAALAIPPGATIGGGTSPVGDGDVGSGDASYPVLPDACSTSVLPTVSESCKTCLTGSCCAAMSACSNDAQCLALLSACSGSSSASCSATSNAVTSAARSLAASVSSCVDTKCDANCFSGL